MEIKTWAPFFPDIDKEWRLFDFPRLAREMAGFEFRPSVDVVKEDDSLKVIAELPGLDSDDVEVSLDGDILMIKGEKTEEKDISEDDRYIHERTFGKFQRHIQLPAGIDADDVSADFDKGVLTVRVALPEDATAEPRRIPVAAKHDVDRPPAFLTSGSDRAASTERRWGRELNHSRSDIG